jgi:hypothetical protein
VSRQGGLRAVHVAWAIGLLVAVSAYLYFAANRDRPGAAEVVTGTQPAVQAPVSSHAGRDESSVPAPSRVEPATRWPSPSHVPSTASAVSASGRNDRLDAEDFIIAAPLEAIHGSTFSVTFGVGPHNLAHSVRFRLNYDVDALELINVVDSSGTVFATVPNGDGSVDLDMDDVHNTVAPPAATFLVRVTEPRTIQFAASADAKDAEGNSLPTTPIAVAPMMLIP